MAELFHQTYNPVAGSIFLSALVATIPPLLLALMLGSFVGVTNWQLAGLPIWIHVIVAIARCAGLWFIQFFLHFFLIFPERSPWLRRFPVRDVARAFELLDAVGLGDFANQRADALSGGQRQRVGIARAIMQEPELLLADEPTSSLDPKTSVEIMELMTRLAGERNIPVIVNIHNVELAKRFAQRMIGMSGGRVVFDGPPDDLRDRHLKEIYGGEGWLE